MDANNADNISTDLDNVFPNRLEAEPKVHLESENSALPKMSMNQERLQTSQKLETEFADYTKQAFLADLEEFCEFELEIEAELGFGIQVDSE